MENKQFVVLGLGVFGSTVATTLAEYGCEVLGVDNDPSCVERIADKITKAAVADITNKEELEELGIGDFDVAIIGVGDHLEQAILATMFVKEMGVPYLIVKAKNKQNMQILQKIGADRVIRVEKEMGDRLARSLVRKNIVDLIEIDEENSVVEIKAPITWVGKTLADINVRNQYKMNILGVKEKGNSRLRLNIGANYIIHLEDSLLVLAKTSVIEEFDRNL